MPPRRTHCPEKAVFSPFRAELKPAGPRLLSPECLRFLQMSEAFPFPETLHPPDTICIRHIGSAVTIPKHRHIKVAYKRTADPGFPGERMLSPLGERNAGMETASEIKSRIISIDETKKVTDAMYMISSVKMQRAKREVLNTEPYFKALKEQIGLLFRYIPETDNRYFRVPSPEQGKHMKHGILLVTSDKGLAGVYNQTAIKVAETYMHRHPETVLFIVGEYGRQYFAGRKIPFVQDFTYSAAFPTVWEARKICTDLLEYYDSGRLDEINIIYTDYISGKPDECKRNCLLPLERSRFYSPERTTAEKTKEFLPDPDTVLNGVIPSYLTGFIYSSLVDSYCSEQEARMEAMSTAGKNAEEILKKLRVRYNRIRQAAITREMTEITSGAKALRQKQGL